MPDPHGRPTIYCVCWRVHPLNYWESWYGVVRSWVAGPPSFNSTDGDYIDAAKALANLVQCHACGRVAPWRGEPTGQCTLDAALAVLKRFYDDMGRRRPEPIPK